MLYPGVHSRQTNPLQIVQSLMQGLQAFTYIFNENEKCPVQSTLHVDGLRYFKTPSAGLTALYPHSSAFIALDGSLVLH